MIEIKYCPRCGTAGAYQAETQKCSWCSGKIITIPNLSWDDYANKIDKEKLFKDLNIHPVISREDARTIMYATNKNEDVLNAMIELKQKDAIEYGIKLAQFKPAAEAVLAKERQEYFREMNTPKCPKCGSTSITTGARGWKLTTGLLGAGKTVNRCAICGHTWKPGK